MQVLLATCLLGACMGTLPPYSQQHTVTEIEGANATLICPNAMVMSVVTASYGGASCKATSEELESNVHEPCNGRSYCKFAGNRSYIAGDRCTESQMAGATFTATFTCSTCAADDVMHTACHTAVTGDTMFKIALTYSAEEFEVCDMNLNQLKLFSSGQWNCSWFPAGFVLRVPDRRACIAHDDSSACYHAKDCQGLEKQCSWPNELVEGGWSGGAYSSYEMVMIVRGWNTDRAFSSILEGNMYRYPSKFMVNYGKPACIPNWYDATTWPSGSRFKYYDCHYLAEGENFWALAGTYGVKAEDLKWANHGIPMVTGAWFKIPKFCVNVPGVSWCYKVRQGDDLWGLSRALGVPAQTLCANQSSFDCDASTVPGSLHYESVELVVPVVYNECHPDKGCSVCSACCEAYIPDGDSCNACVTSKC